MKSMRRVLRYDGVLPMKMNDDRSFAQMTPADIQATKTFIDERRSETTTPIIEYQDDNMMTEETRKVHAVVMWLDYTLL